REIGRERADQALGGARAHEGERHLSACAPETFTTRAHFSMSSRMKRANSSGLIDIAIAPCFAHASFKSGAPVALVISAFRRSTIAFGVPAGAMKPSQI